VNYLSGAIQKLNIMRISIGCDHAGPELKALLMGRFGQHHTFINRGTDGTDSVDYPDYAHQVAEDVASGDAAMGILICGSANGVAMTANKHPGVRAAIAWSKEVARLARAHNDANILCIPARFVTQEQAIEMTESFVRTDFEGGRHAGRVNKIMRTLYCVLLGGWASVGWAQAPAYPYPDAARHFAQGVDSVDLKAHLSVLASDAFEGRETGTAGAQLAADYIAERFAALGLEPMVEGTYFQPVSMKSEAILGGQCSMGAQALQYMEDFVFYPGIQDTEILDKEVVFAGFGIRESAWDDYAGLEVKDRVVLVLAGEPVDASGKNRLDGRWLEALEAKRDLAMELGARALVIVSQDFGVTRSRLKPWLESKGLRLDRDDPEASDWGTALPTFFVREEATADWWAGTAGKDVENLRKDVARRGTLWRGPLPGLRWSAQIEKQRASVQGVNVAGAVVGTDPQLSKEWLVITAHYDHVGVIKGQIHNGADDDGSGTVTLLELAQAFADAKRSGFGPRRSVLFLAVVGEEKGLLGSEWYTLNPLVSLEQTVANLNIDMIGRVDDAHTSDERYVYLIGSDRLSSDLHAISEQANSIFSGLALDYTFNAESDPNRYYYRSDHYNFAKNGIPVIFYFSGVHEDYHKPGDDVEKIRFGKMESIGRLVFHTAWQLVFQDDRIKVDGSVD
jgi:RpiB/LacA/LacB family sugar-phosphate isomerase